MDWSLWLPPVIIIVLLCMSGFFSGSETALTAASRARLFQMERDGDKKARRANYLIQDRESLIGAILLGNNLVNILASAIATAWLLRLFGDAGVAIATGVMTLLVLVFAEVLPKTYAIANAEKMARGVSLPIQLLVKVLAPILKVIQFVVRGVLALFGVRGTENALSAHDEIRGAIDLHHQEGGVFKDDRDMLGGILDLRNLVVEDVMIHRKSMQMIDASLSCEEVVDAVLQSRHTRLPVWKGEHENIIGVLHAKDLFREVQARGGPKGIDIASVAREPWFVPETTTLLDQLDAFRTKREHFALVVDEYGALQGVVTLEDILEEIVGEIDDEHDQPVQGVSTQKDGSVLVDGWVTIRDLNRAKDWTLPDDEAVTVAGLVIHEARTIPDKGQTFRFHGARFEIVARKRNQVTQLRITMENDAEA